MAYFNNKPINEISTKEILGGAKEVLLNICFYNEVVKELGYLEAIITSERKL